MNAQDLIREFGVLQSDRGTWESHWDEIAQRVLPAYSGAFTQGSLARTPGAKRTEYLFDATAAVALGRFAAVVDSLLTPMNSRWHRIVASNADLQKVRRVRSWFEDANNLLFKYREAPKANFRSQNHEDFRMLGAFGTGTLFIDALKDEPGLRYRSIHLAEIFFAENHQGIIDQAWRLFEMTGRQMAQRWKTLPEKIQASLATTPNKKWEVLHCVRPRSDRDPGRADYKGMAFESWYISKDCGETLEEGGYRTFPYAISRYWQAPGEIYGRSPAMDVLPAIKTLNEQKKTMLKQGHRVVDPVLLLPDDGVLDSFSLRPGALNSGAVTSDGRPLVHPLPTGNLAAGKDMMDEERMLINDAFLVSLFQILVDTPTMTATEVLERTKEKGMILTPTVGRQQSERLGPQIERELDVLVQQGLLLPMPGELIEAQGEYHVEYEGPMARAMRAEFASGAMRSIENTLALVNVTQDPSPLDHFNMDVITPAIAEINGTPLSWMNTMEAVQAIREGRAQQAQQQQMIDAAPAAASVMKTMKDMPANA